MDLSEGGSGTGDHDGWSWVNAALRGDLDGLQTVWLLRRPIAIVVRRAHLGFLGASPFRRNSPDLEHWIFLHFLGFSRANLDFSMGYDGFSRQSFSHALFAG
jgi:hypothetical protein